MDHDDPAVFYQPGNVLHQEEPFVRMIYIKYRDYYCDYCLLGAVDSEYPYKFQLTACKFCKYVKHCSKTCRKSAWILHQLECPHLKKLPRARGDFIRLVGLVALAVQGRDWNEITATVFGKARSFEDLNSNCHITENDPKLRLYGLEMCKLVREYLGKALQYDDHQLIELIGKVKYNKYGVLGKGLALYIGASVFEYCCVPTAFLSYRGTQVTFRSCAKILKGDSRRVLIGYSRKIDMDNWYAEVKKNFCGPCLCFDCQQPYGYGYLTKILDWDRAYSVIECTELALEKLEAYWRNGGEQLNEECTQVLNVLAEMQKDVLGNTHLLRMRFLYMKACYEKDLSIKLEDLKLVYNFAKNAFGPWSEELFYIGKDIVEVFTALGNQEGANHYKKELMELENLLSNEL